MRFLSGAWKYSTLVLALLSVCMFLLLGAVSSPLGLALIRAVPYAVPRLRQAEVWSFLLFFILGYLTCWKWSTEHTSGRERSLYGIVGCVWFCVLVAIVEGALVVCGLLRESALFGGGAWAFVAPGVVPWLHYLALRVRGRAVQGARTTAVDHT